MAPNNASHSWSAIRRVMMQNKVYEKDLDEQFVRSSGSGGQNVNKVATCVQLVHLPSGTAVKCQTRRTQGGNRLEARRLLVKKLVKAQRAQERQRQDQLAKERRKSRKRSARAKDVMLEQKRQQSDKKQGRRKISVQNIDKCL